MPGDQPNKFAKAASSETDVVVVDLEDAVSNARKDYARDALAEWLMSEPGIPLVIRINPIDSRCGSLDLETVLSNENGMILGIRLPKVEKISDVTTVADRIRIAGSDLGIFPIIESAIGVENVQQLAACDALIKGVCIGFGDLLADISPLAGPEAINWAMGRFIMAVRGAGLPAPPLGVYPDIRNLDALRKSTESGRAVGFIGRSAFHPAQIPVINEVFTPSIKAVEEANEIIDLYSDPQQGAILLHGKIVDYADLVRAEQLVDLFNLTLTQNEAGG